MATATRARSRSSRPATRNEYTRYATPDDPEPFPTLEGDATTSLKGYPGGSTALYFDSREPVQEGLGNLNRWSQSTSSSQSPRSRVTRGGSVSSKAPISPTNFRQSPRRTDEAGSYEDIRHVNTENAFSNQDKLLDRRQRAPSQKAMLSKALQKANTAVLLDNAANIEGAIEAYNDACELLQWVMLRSNGADEEKLRLQEIRDTYMIRITELEHLDRTFQHGNSKALPQRPLSDESFGDMLGQEFEPSTRHNPKDSQVVYSAKLPPRRESLLPSVFDDELRYMTPSSQSNLYNNLPRSESSLNNLTEDYTDRTILATDGSSPHGLSPTRQTSPEMLNAETVTMSKPAEFAKFIDAHEAAARGRNSGSMSWLDTIDESGVSSHSSTRSQTSSLYFRRRSHRPLSNGTVAELDAALDAAVEAAYNDGFDPSFDEYEDSSNNNDIPSNTLGNMGSAEQEVEEDEREAESFLMHDRDLQAQEQVVSDSSNSYHLGLCDEEAEEEERLLDEMTNDYVINEFEFDLQSKSTLPRQSSSSGSTGRTWGSSLASNVPQAAVPLCPVAEDAVLPPVDAELKSPDSPTGGSAPSLTGEVSLGTAILQTSVLAKPPNLVSSSGPSVRARRLSGQNLKELKIETNSHILQPGVDATANDKFKSHERNDSLMSALANDSEAPDAAQPNKRNPSDQSGARESLTRPGLTRALTEDGTSFGRSGIPLPGRPIGKVPSAPDNLGKLKTFRSRNESISTTDQRSDSPKTPSSSIFPFSDLQKVASVSVGTVLPTPTTSATFTPTVLDADGLHLFDSNIHSPSSPGSPNPLATDAPIPLEPCPESFLLRPFWLLRCIYQTVAHPRGGYLSTKLFVPRDVWHVKNVKIKAVEEKVSQCDLLTAALLKLAQVDTYDADAVLDEMQAFENVLDQVQAALTKKLGSEVGLQGATLLFKGSGSDDLANAPDTMPSKSSSGTGKSYLSSWRKLRSKTSGHSSGTTVVNIKEASKDSLTVSTVPMTSTPNSHFTQRKVTQLQLNGPNANYMGALARLCDAAQVIDQIARQVEDPGLRHSSQTLVGLELSTRHAAEFFGFFICRFALNDICLMLDKFIKRGSEWVLL